MLLIGFAGYLDLEALFVDGFFFDSIENWGNWHSLPISMMPIVPSIIYPTLFLRWRYPRTVFLIFISVQILTFVLWGATVADLALLIALYPLARRGSAGIANVAFIIYIIPMVTIRYIKVVYIRFENMEVTSSVDDIRLFVSIVMSEIFTAFFVWSFGRLLYLNERRAERERKEQTEAALRAERLNLARELHDIVSHSVSAMIFQAAGARTVASSADKQVQGALEAIETTGVQAMGELHRLLGLLRNASLEERSHGVTHPPTLQDLDSLVSSARASGVDVEVVVDGHPAELDRSVGLAAYRVVQEALTNTIKYAGRGAFSRINLRWDQENLTLTIRDRSGLQKREATGLSSGHGLIGLKERVNLVGGTLETGPTSDGFLIRAQLPVRPSAPLPVSSVVSDKDKT